MARQKNVAISENEKEILDTVRDIWMEESVSYGYVIERLAMEKLAELEVEQYYKSGDIDIYRRRLELQEEDTGLDKHHGRGVINPNSPDED